MEKWKNYFLTANILILLFCGSCGCPVLEVDLVQLEEKIYEPSAIRYKTLASSTVLYLDHSTCVVDARQNSPVFNALRPQLGQYSDTLCLIKGSVLESIPLNRSDNEVFRILQTIQQDIPYSDILKAVEQICSSNQQAILITDCEFIKDNLCHDSDPYLSEPFKRWLQRGYVIYIVTEPYQEKTRGRTYDKKRFYFIFTDERIGAPISHNMLNELRPFINSKVSVFKLINSDLQVKRNGEMFSEDLDISDVEQKNGFEYVEINNDWDEIREYVMKLDKYDEPLPDENPLPLIKNLVFNDGENYVIRDVEVVASNITSQYLALSDSLNEAETVPETVDISDGFMIDKEALQANKLNVMLTNKIFNHLECGGNLIRLDFVITQVELKPYDANIFTWQSLYNPTEAICVAKSIDNALRDIEVVPTYKDRRVIHTVFLKTQSYN
jgi:predicted transcriptional regulator with HTH domain